MLATLNDILPAARANHYAVGLFNTVNLEMAQGVLAAAEELRSPVIIGTAEVLLPYASLEELAPMLKDMARRASVPVVLHYDHGLTVERIKQALALGFTSIMYDCSTVSDDENARKVAEIAKFAHERGATVEAELGHVGSNETDTDTPSDDKSLMTIPEAAKRFADAASCDALAVAIGNAHGAYRAKPKLDLERLDAIASLVDCPLVLHGGSGLSDDDFRACIQRGIAKVNIFTDINVAQAKAAHAAWSEGKGITELMPVMRQAVKAAATEKILLFGSSGRA